MELSIVTTAYYSSPYIREFHSRVSAVARKLVGDDYEIIFVNDGSPDDSLKILKNLVNEDCNLKVIDLSRNFGHYKALWTGLSHAKGDRIFLIDSDLEEDPEYLELFNSKLNEIGCDVVFGVQSKRRGRFWEQWNGKLFYIVLNWLTGLGHSHDVLVARLMTRDYLDALLSFQEREIFISGLWQITGFHQVAIPVHKHSTSATTYTFRKKIALVINAIVSFSDIPLKAIFYVGCIILLLAILQIAHLFILKIIFDGVVSGWASLMASIWLLGGMIIAFLGIIGIYLSKIFLEVKRRPLSIIRRIYTKSHE